MSEQELAKHVVAWLENEHWDVYQEVQFFTGSGIADIVAVRSNLVWIIECKTTMSLAVMEQAAGWRVHFRSIAIPAAKQADRRTAFAICKDYFQIGVLVLGEYNEIYEKISPPLKREYHRFAKDRMKTLSPEHKVYAQAGAKNGGHFTPYKRTIRAVREYITRNPGCTLKEIIDSVGRGHYAHKQSARSTIRTALIEWESEWCRIDLSASPYKYYIQEVVSIDQ